MGDLLALGLLALSFGLFFGLLEALEGMGWKP